MDKKEGGRRRKVKKKLKKNKRKKGKKAKKNQKILQAGQIRILNWPLLRNNRCGG